MLRARGWRCPGGPLRWSGLVVGRLVFGGVSRVCVVLSSLAVLLCCLAVVPGFAACVVRAVVSFGLRVWWACVARAGVVGLFVGAVACVPVRGVASPSRVSCVVACVRGAVVGVRRLVFCVAVSVGAGCWSSVGGVASVARALLFCGGSSGSCGAVVWWVVAAVVRALSGALWFWGGSRSRGSSFFFG